MEGGGRAGAMPVSAGCVNMGVDMEGGGGGTALWWWLFMFMAMPMEELIPPKGLGREDAPPPDPYRLLPPPPPPPPPGEFHPDCMPGGKRGMDLLLLTLLLMLSMPLGLRGRPIPDTAMDRATPAPDTDVRAGPEVR